MILADEAYIRKQLESALAYLEAGRYGPAHEAARRALESLEDGYRAEREQVVAALRQS